MVAACFLQLTTNIINIFQHSHGSQILEYDIIVIRKKYPIDQAGFYGKLSCRYVAWKAKSPGMAKQATHVEQAA